MTSHTRRWKRPLFHIKFFPKVKIIYVETPPILGFTQQTMFNLLFSFLKGPLQNYGVFQLYVNKLYKIQQVYIFHLTQFSECAQYNEHKLIPQPVFTWCIRLDYTWLVYSFMCHSCWTWWILAAVEVTCFQGNLLPKNVFLSYIYFLSFLQELKMSCMVVLTLSFYLYSTLCVD